VCVGRARSKKKELCSLELWVREARQEEENATKGRVSRRYRQDAITWIATRYYFIINKNNLRYIDNFLSQKLVDIF